MSQLESISSLKDVYEVIKARMQEAGDAHWPITHDEFVLFYDLGCRHFPGADLRQMDFTNSVLSHLDFKRANLSGVSFHNAKLNGTILQGATLRGAKITLTELHTANLAHADLTEANLCASYVVEADLSHACLVSADLYNTNMMNSDMSQTDLTGASFEGTNLYGVTGVASVENYSSWGGQMVIWVHPDGSLMVSAPAHHGITTDKFRASIKRYEGKSKQEYEEALDFLERVAARNFKNILKG